MYYDTNNDSILFDEGRIYKQVYRCLIYHDDLHKATHLTTSLIVQGHIGM